MTVISNLASRLRVLGIILTKRSFWIPLAQLAYPYHTITDIRANIHPLHFGKLILKGHRSSLNFAQSLGPISSFERAGTPKWNSEAGVSEFLGELVYNLEPATVVELGCFVGWTSAHLAVGLREAGCEYKLWCVDIDEHFLEVAKANLTRLGLHHHVDFLCGQSLDHTILARLPSAIDVIFVDTSHSYEATRNEIATYARRLRPGGYIILHDSISFPGVRRAIFEMSDQFSCMTFATEQGWGLTVFQSKA